MAASPGRDARLRSMAATIRLAFKSKHWGTHAARLLAQLLPPPTSPLPPPLEVCACQGLSRDLRCEFKAAFFKRAVRVSVVPLRGVVSLQQCQGSRARAAGTCSMVPFRVGGFICRRAHERRAARAHSLPKVAAAAVAVTEPGIKLQRYKQSLLCASQPISYP